MIGTESSFPNKPKEPQTTVEVGNTQPVVLTTDQMREYLSKPTEISAADMQALQILDAYYHSKKHFPKKTLARYFRKYLQQSADENAENYKKPYYFKSINIRQTVLSLLEQFTETPQQKIAKLNQKLHPTAIKRTHEESLEKKFPDGSSSPEFKQSSSLFPWDVEKYLQNQENFSQDDIDFLHFLDAMYKNPALFSKADYVKKIEEYIKNSVIADQQKAPGSAIDSRVKKIRKTALGQYKIAIIPEQRIVEGGYKAATLPIGASPELRSPYVQHVLRVIGPVWNWDGVFPSFVDQSFSPELEQERTPEQIVKISSSNRTLAEDQMDAAAKFLEVPIVSPRITSELQKVQALSESLGNPSYLPNIKRANTSDRLTITEYLPNPYESESGQEVIETALQLIAALEELWQKAGIIDSDLKPENVRKNKQKKIVLLDFGGTIELTPGQETVRIPRYPVTTLMYAWPEVMTAFSENEILVPVEKLLVFDIGKMLLCDIFGRGAVGDVVDHGIGKVQAAGFGDEDDEYSINQATAVELRAKHYAWNQVDETVLNLIEKMLSNKPSNRPTLDEVKKVLTAALPQTA